MTRTRIEPPQWFRDKKYDYPNDAIGWLEALKWIDALMSPVALPDPSAEARRREWQGVIEDFDRYKQVRPISPACRIVHCLEELKEPSGNTVLFQVAVDAPDKTIRDAFERALKEMRRSHQTPVRNRGKNSMNADFNEANMYAWKNHKIIELAELIAWKEREKPSGINYGHIGKWLMPDGYSNGPDRWFKEAKSTLKDACSKMDALQIQVRGADATDALI